MKKVLLILGNEDLREALTTTLQQEYEVTICSDAQASAELHRQGFDGLILEMNADSLLLLENFRGNLPPAVIVFTRLLCDDVLRVSANYGVSYLIRIPCSVNQINVRLAQSLKA